METFFVQLFSFWLLTFDYNVIKEKYHQPLELCT